MTFTELQNKRKFDLNESVTEFLRWPTHSSIEVTRDVLNGWIKSYVNKNFYQWAIV